MKPKTSTEILTVIVHESCFLQFISWSMGNFWLPCKFVFNIKSYNLYVKKPVEQGLYSRELMTSSGKNKVFILFILKMNEHGLLPRKHFEEVRVRIIYFKNISQQFELVWQMFWQYHYQNTILTFKFRIMNSSPPRNEKSQSDK